MKLQETAERRQITILHCDIVNSTEIVDSLDPEEVLLIMESNLNNWTKIVEDFRGIFVGYTGDGFQAYFGYPFSREDAAADAVSAAVQVSRMFAAQDNKIQKELECRIGVATGQVVVGQPNTGQIGQRFVAFGSVPSLAARLEQAANPSCILVDKATMRLTAGQFTYREIGIVPAKGFRQDVEAWEVVRKRRPTQRFDSTNLSPYVNRHHEFGILSDRWRSAVDGNGQVVLLHGEPGIGKSRLVFEFERSLGNDQKVAYRLQCSSQNTLTALHPWFHWVLRFADIRQQDSAEMIHAKLHDCLHIRLGFSREVVTISETIMGFFPADAAKPNGPSPQKALTRLQRALVDNIVNAANDTPQFVLVEDIHWMDASTQGFIELLIERAHDKKIFLALTCRPEKLPTFEFPNLTLLPLKRLENAAVSELVAPFISSVSDGNDKKAMMSTIEKCEGNPLFVEELSKHYLERQSRGGAAAVKQARGDDVPVLLQGSLMERIDTAGRGKEVAQLASVIGREFDRDIVIKLSTQPADEVQNNLDQLCELSILSRNSFEDRVFYAFRHALLREAVYSSLLHKARKTIHLKVAPLLAGERQTYSAEIIARHFESGGDRDSAFSYWLEAGQHALQSGATVEAVSLLGSALRLAKFIEDSDERTEDLANMYLAYGCALNASLGVVAEPIKYFQKAEEFASRLDRTETVLESLDWQFGMQFNAGELTASREPALKMKRLGLMMSDSRALASGFQSLGMVHFMRGELTDARDEFEQGLKAAGRYVSGKHCFPSMSLSYLAWTYYILGRSAKAASTAKRAIASARRESSHALATALSNCSYVYQCLGDVERVYACVGELVDHAKKHGELMYLKRGTMTRKWADFVSGIQDHSIDAIREHIDLLLESKEEIEVTYHLGVLADLQIRQGQYVEASGSLDKALEIARKNNENFFVAELYRLKARALELGPDALSAGDDTDYISLARDIAKSQDAKAWLRQLPQRVKQR